MSRPIWSASPQAEHFSTLGRLLPLFHKACGYVAAPIAKEEPFTAALSAIPWHTLAARML